MKNTFLNDDLNGEIYMNDPPCFGKKSNLTWFGKIFGSKQSSRQWFEKFTQDVNRPGIIITNNNDDKITILIVFLDDTIIIRDNHEKLASLKRYLIGEF